jgi:hypothetical protein
MTGHRVAALFVLPLLLAGCKAPTSPYEREIAARPEPATEAERNAECKWVDGQLESLYTTLETRGFLGGSYNPDQRAFFLQRIAPLNGRASRYGCSLMPPTSYANCQSRYTALYNMDFGQLFFKCADMPDAPGAESRKAR